MNHSCPEHCVTKATETKTDRQYKSTPALSFNVFLIVLFTVSLATATAWTVFLRKCHDPLNSHVQVNNSQEVHLVQLKNQILSMLYINPQLCCCCIRTVHFVAEHPKRYLVSDAEAHSAQMS